jgi:competence protein ComEC
VRAGTLVPFHARGEGMPGSALAFVAGTCVLLLLPRLPAPVLLATLALLACAAGWWLRCCVPLAFVAGLLSCGLVASARLEDRLAPALEGRTLAIEGRVASVPQAVAHGLRFRFEPAAGVITLPSTLELTWYEPDFRPLPAERLALEVRLRRPRGFVNPGGSDYVARMLREKVGATGYVRAAVRLGRGWHDVVACPVLVARGEAARTIVSALGDRPATGIVTGLAVGLQDALSPSQWRALARSGTTHLMAISGMHIGMVAAIAAWLAGAIQRSRQRRGALGTTRDAAVRAGVTAAIGYSALAGWSVPTQRTALTILLVALVLGARRRIVAWHGLALAAAAVLLADPLAALAPGFWLSFGAVAVILFATGGQVARPALLRGYGHLQLAVTVGLTPVLIGSFGGVSLVSAVVNLPAIPLYTLLIVPAVLIGTALSMVAPLLGQPVLRAVAWLIETTWPLIEMPASWPWAAWHVAGLPPALWAVLVVATVAAIAPLPAAGRAAACLAVAAIAAWRPAPLPEHAVRVTLLDVGQGLSIIAETRAHVLVYDTGPSFRSGADAALLAIGPYLRQRAVRAIDLLVVSHDDADHADGAVTLAGSFLVRARAASGRALGTSGVIRCARGARWTWDGVEFEWLHPGPVASGSDNDRSCVLRVAAGEHVALLTGDIERGAEDEILEAAPPGRIEVLVVPHHGSRSSSGPALIAATRPRWALISAGHGNRWNLPADAVVQRWREAGSQVLVSAHTGAMEFDLRAGRPTAPPRLARAAAARFWQRDERSRPVARAAGP